MNTHTRRGVVTLDDLEIGAEITLPDQWRNEGAGKGKGRQPSGAGQKGGAK